MLTFYGSRSAGPIDVPADGELPESVEWIDAFEPTAAEYVRLRQVMGVRIPTIENLLEVESSSRLSAEGATLLMSLPASVREPEGFPRTSAIGFVLNRARLVTVRYAHFPSFEYLVQQMAAQGALAGGGLGATLTILEVIVDHLADMLEHIGADLDAMGRQVFTEGLAQRNRRPRAANEELSRMLRKVGEDGAFLSKVSESLLGLNRMVPFLTSKGKDLVSPELLPRLETVNQDAKSLREYEEHLANRTQFLLDTLLGFANIEQNNVFRVLTVVSVVGIPPTFFASMYGMNFKNIPEYDWSWGYQYGLTLIILSGLLPAIWFKIKGWW